MKICQPHWDKLRAALEARSILHLGAKTGEEATKNIKTELEGGKPPYDPLMSCHWMVVNQALLLGGPYLLGVKDDGSEYCPICEAVEKGGVDENEWINGPADAALEYCKENGLVPSA